MQLTRRARLEGAPPVHYLLTNRMFGGCTFETLNVAHKMLLAIFCSRDYNSIPYHAAIIDEAAGTGNIVTIRLWNATLAKVLLRGFICQSPRMRNELSGGIITI